MEATDRSRRVLHFGPFTADLDARSLCNRSRRIPLQDQPFRVLALLLERPGELVTRNELRQRLWAANTLVDFDHGLNIAINKLRDALGDSADQPRYIHTVPRRGYRFVAQLDQPVLVPAVTADGEPPAFAERPVAQPTDTGSAPPAGRRILWAIALVGLSVAALAALYVAAVQEKTLDIVHGGSISSLAVLPLENLSQDPAQDYFADGMTDELITSLAKLQSVKVISRSSVVRYKGSTRPLPDIARELKVDGIVEGTVLHSGNRVRITVQLIRAATDQHLWAETYDGNVQDVISLQDAIARAVAAEIRVKLGPEQQARVKNSKSVNPAAYEAYLRGRYLLYDRWTKESNAAAARYYEQAIATDPGYAPAYAGLADYYAFKGFDEPTDRAAAGKAKELAAQALKLDAGLADAHIAMANVLFRADWNWAAAEREYRRGIELNPHAPSFYFNYALYLGALGRHEAAIAAMNRAIDLDPFSATMNTGLAIVLQWAGRNDQAVVQARKAIALDPLLADAHFMLASAYEQLGRYDETIVEYLDDDRLSGIDSSIVADFKRAYANSGINGYRSKKLDWEKLQVGSGRANYFLMAKLAAELGETDAAFHWLEKSYQEHSVRVVNIKVAASLRSLHADPRFSDLVRRIGLP